MHIGEFLNKLAAKAGIKADDPDLVGILAAPGLQQMPISDALASQFDNSLLTIAAATNNHPEVKKVYFAQAYNGLDAELEQTMTDLGFDETVKAAIKGEKSSTKRAAMVAVKAKEIAAAEAKAAGSGADSAKVAALNADVVRLNGLLADKDKIFSAKQAEFDGKLLDIKKQGDLEKLLKKYVTVYDDLGPVAKDAAVNALLNQNLQDSGATFGYDEKGQFTILRSEGGPLFGDNHTVVTPENFIDKSLSKILKQTEVPAPAPVQFGNNRQPVQNQQQQMPANSALTAKLTESMQAYEASNK